MKPIFLIAVNFMRSQWIVLTIMLVYVVAMLGFIGLHEQRSEVLFFIRQLSFYAIFLGTMLTIPAIQNERKSRRILAVLSKGIHRWQYLAGLLLGALLIIAAFCLAVGLATWWLARQASFPTAGLGDYILVLFLGCAACAAVSLFSSVFLHPFVALPVAIIILFLPLALELRGVYLSALLFPVSAITHVVSDYTFQPPGTGLWRIGASAAMQTVVFWALASLLFARRDITVTSE